jgi:hypothetical protein
MNRNIKIGEPLEKAYDRTIEYCFQPFNYTKWLIMGFVVWVMTMGQGGGGGNFNFSPGKFGKLFSTPNSTSSTSTTTTGGTNSAFAQIKDFIDQHLTQEVIIISIIVAVVVILVFLAIWLVMEWLKSRFQFIFLDNIISDSYNIKQPWANFKILGNSLFKWSILFTTISSIIILIMLGLTIGIPLKMCWSSIQAEQLLPEGKNGLIIGGVFLFFTIIVSLIITVIRFIAIELLVPIMYRYKLTITNAWRKFRPVLKANKANIALFIIVNWIVTIAVGSVAVVALLIIMVFTCFFLCLGFLPFIGGYITAVLMLPVTIFYRMFSYEYAMQFKLNLTPEPSENLISEEVQDIDNFDPKMI